MLSSELWGRSWGAPAQSHPQSGPDHGTPSLWNPFCLDWVGLPGLPCSPLWGLTGETCRRRPAVEASQRAGDQPKAPACSDPCWYFSFCSPGPPSPHRLQQPQSRTLEDGVPCALSWALEPSCATLLKCLIQAVSFSEPPVLLLKSCSQL